MILGQQNIANHTSFIVCFESGKNIGVKCTYFGMEKYTMFENVFTLVWKGIGAVWERECTFHGTV